MAERPTVRLATMDDLDFVAQDGHIPGEVVAGKIGRDEVVVAERDGESVGYVGVGIDEKYNLEKKVKPSNT